MIKTLEDLQKIIKEQKKEINEHLSYIMLIENSYLEGCNK